MRLFLCVIFAGIVIHVFSQNARPVEDLHFNWNYVKSFPVSESKILSSPFRWDKNQWKFTAYVVSTGLFFYAIEKDVKNVIQKNQNPNLSFLSHNILDPLGSGKFSIPIIGSLYITSKLIKDSPLESASLLAAKAFVLSGFSVQLFKQVLHRPRPYQYDLGNHQILDGPFGNAEFTSMPSGHSITAFSIASALAHSYPNKKWVGISAYSLAGCVALSRIYDNKHWLSDVFIGSVMGWAIGKYVVNAYNFPDKHSRNKLEALPVYK